MISRKLFFFAMVTLFCMIFIELSQTAPLIKRQVGKVAFADFEGKVTGRFTWTNIPEEKCRVTGQFNTGLDKPDIGDYKLCIEDDDGKVIQDLTDEFRRKVTINPPGSSPFEVDFPSMTVEDVVGDNLVLKFKEYKIGEAKIKSV
ncbi:unnamed protein product [Rhizophagus irregularis]|uniref:Uncharacterized protein n=1 Tax=Rhizophagus irregularis TaxID=588596 RepID=A0A2N1N247_9GLOM|nr:hypothetical protein RhiirC2_713744 [Rhizophagus irregularis]CAB4379664.1 unnamed protein product [Rhizophagus irregularis]CAB5335982.1 unnamed protein product [Rhizophagus irregularis]